MKELQKRLTNLLTIKSIVTIVLTMVFAYLGVTGKVKPEMIVAIYTTIIGFYFGTQTKEGGD